MEEVILVDRDNHQIGTEEKLKAHQDGKLHRAISIFIYNSQGKMLIAQRSLIKYHSAGLWSNAVCSHPRPGEKSIDTAHRRLEEEIGFDCPLKKIFNFNYWVKFDNGLIENEMDKVYSGVYNGEVKLNPDEAIDYKWIAIPELKKDIKDNPDKYTYWLKKMIQENKILEIKTSPVGEE